MVCRSQPSWYLSEGVGLSAVNDITFLENAAFIVAKKHFRKKPYYVDLVDLMHAAVFRSSFGKGLDLMSEKINDCQAAYRFSMNLYETVMKNKSAYTGFYLPVALAMIMSGIKSDKAFRMVKKITLNIGLYFQAQDDFIDVFGMPEQAGRISSDIVNGKCSWPIVAAFERANDIQRKILLENYGQTDHMKISIIKNMFGCLNIQEIYWNFEYGARKNINEEVDELPNELPKPLFQLIMAAIAGRQS
ncbi:unnamed protein product [Allacma fusca]|uniref:Uncharacterized protein n=1 Tax=Allacma fusca TaxID=39272 RepID=A0A8J2P689_9HEXA|nr:unnamed protein product [Allacma fusca]